MSRDCENRTRPQRRIDPRLPSSVISLCGFSRSPGQHENSVCVKHVKHRRELLHPPLPRPRNPPFRLRLYDPVSNPETLARRTFPGASFYWSANIRRIHTARARARARERERERERESPSSFSAAAGSEPRLLGPLDARVFRGVLRPPCSLPPSPPPPFARHGHPRDPLISGLRGSRNEPSEARWHEEGSVGWVAVCTDRREGDRGNCSKLRYRGLATLTPLYPVDLPRPAPPRPAPHHVVPRGNPGRGEATPVSSWKTSGARRRFIFQDVIVGDRCYARRAALRSPRDRVRVSGCFLAADSKFCN